MRLLLISNSAKPGQPYLGYATPFIHDFLGNTPKKILFIPFAAVTYGFDEYVTKVNNALKDTGHVAYGIHHEAQPLKAVMEAEAIMVGGGNTFRLLSMMQELGIIPAVRERVLSAGVPYLGWSAGANVACPTICTTNDMPIVQPLDFGAFNLIDFQINPHYLDAHPTNHGGETREQRINEYLVANPDKYVIGLRENTMLRVEGNEYELKGELDARVFHYGDEPVEVAPSVLPHTLLGIRLR
ncbi:dipeptidase PepE [Porphyromonas pogonae]|uniref:dipeptidase PepE n=1 Tax=Porphyromonas pogonae TaxID=867595 RepID=UPI002E797D89|nr:dipeptidase PepE [Porphyromonas pogonae]